MKKNIVYIVGHKNPDIDSICSAISYAYLKNIIDPLKKYIPISCGEINNKIKNLLNFFNVDIPIFKNDFYPMLNNIKDKNKLEFIIKENINFFNELKSNLNFSFNHEEKVINIIKTITENDVLIKKTLFNIIDNNKKILGFFNKENLIENFHNEIILVDHNEKSQSIDGIEFCNIIEIIDHHRLSNEPTVNPIKFINEPIGSTCTIIAEMLYQQKNIKVDTKIAGLLISGIISDTINLKSPTTTQKDKEILKWLQSICDFNLDEIIKIIFYSYSILENEPIYNIINYDCKIYKELNISFSISQIEETSFDHFFIKYKDILQYMNIFMMNNKLDFSLFVITNINNNSSLLLITENEKYNIKEYIHYPSINNKKIIFQLQNIVSRKKQLTPYIINIIKNLSLH